MQALFSDCNGSKNVYNRDMFKLDEEQHELTQTTKKKQKKHTNIQNNIPTYKIIFVIKVFSSCPVIRQFIKNCD